MKKTHNFIASLENLDLTKKQKEKISSGIKELILEELAEIDFNGDAHIKDNFWSHSIFDKFPIDSTLGVWIDFDGIPHQVGTIFLRYGGVGPKHNYLLGKVLDSRPKTKNELRKAFLSLEDRSLDGINKNKLIENSIDFQKSGSIKEYSAQVAKFVDKGKDIIESSSKLNELEERMENLYTEAVEFDLTYNELASIFCYTEVSKSSAEFWFYREDGGSGMGEDLLKAEYGNGKKKIKRVVAADGAGAAGSCLSTGIVGGLAGGPIGAGVFLGSVAFSAAWSSATAALISDDD